VCKIEDGVVFQNAQTMITIHGEPLMRRINEIIDRVVESGIYKFWNSLLMNWYKIFFREISLVHPLVGILQFQTLSHATCLLSPLNGLVSKCSLFYVRVREKSRFKQKNVNMTNACLYLFN
jgi:hypothetical protein